jgi:hypothetical protein
MVNCLSALALINNGVREILPFVRYIGQFIDFEFNAIRSQDQGQGVVCASTWYDLSHIRTLNWQPLITISGLCLLQW